jgi:hypothetical protein
MTVRVSPCQDHCPATADTSAPVQAVVEAESSKYEHGTLATMALSDTTPEAAALQTAIHRRLGGDGRFRLAVEISDVVWTYARAGARIRHPGGREPDVLSRVDAGRPVHHGGAVSVGELFVRIRAALQAADVPHMLTGSFASSLHGAPRATQDIDIVIAPTRDQLLALLSLFPDDAFYVSRDAALDALARHEQFNVIDLATGWKIDFIFRKPREFSREEFERRRPVELSGVELDVASAEDVLIAKLEWAKLGASARQIDDAAGIIRLQGGSLDRAYVERWVRALGLHEQWQAAQVRAV